MLPPRRGGVMRRAASRDGSWSVLGVMAAETACRREVDAHRSAVLQCLNRTGKRKSVRRRISRLPAFSADFRLSEPFHAAGRRRPRFSRIT